MTKSAGPTDPPEYPWLYAIPGVLFGGGYIAAASTGLAGLVQAGYLVSSLLCFGESHIRDAPLPKTLISFLGSISGLASQTTARQGNILGILGVGSGILASLVAVGFSPEVLMQFAALASIGSIVGKLHLILKDAEPHATAGALIGRRITPTELPQTVAALHSVVGLAAVLTSIGSVMMEIAHVSVLHMVTAYMGVLIGSLQTLPINTC